MAHDYARTVTFYFRRFRMILRLWENETWGIGISFVDADEKENLETQGFEDPISAVKSLGTYVDTLLYGARFITRVKVTRAMKKLIRDVLKGEAR